MGSGNALARALGLPIDPAKALGEILDGDVRAIDVGTVAGRHFFSTAGVGLDAAVCHLYASRPDRRRGFLPYLALTLRAYLSYVPVETVITLADGVEIRTHPTIATVANTSQFGNGAIIAPEALPDDGVLDLCVIDDTGVLRALWHSRRLFRGTIDRMPGVRLFRSRCIRIARPRPGATPGGWRSDRGGGHPESENPPSRGPRCGPERWPSIMTPERGRNCTRARA